MSTPVEHSSLGPSSWERWVRCAGAPTAEAAHPDRTSYEAAEGTVFHEMVSDCLALGLEPEWFLGGGLNQDGHWIEFDWEMVNSAQDGLAFVRGMAARPGWKLWVETRVDISPWTLPGQFGTADVILANFETREIIVFDWKYGKEPVYAAENLQLIGYCLGAWNTLLSAAFGGDAAGIKVTLIIEQPRVSGAGGAWETTLVRVLEIGQHVKRQAVLSTDPDAPRVPGPKQCRWCRARATCGARAEWLLETVGVVFDDAETFAPEEPWQPPDVTPERRSYILSIAPQVREFLERLHESAMRDAERGEPVPGFKIVDGRRPNRYFAENKRHMAEQILVSEIGRRAYTEPQLISPTQAEKVMGKPRYREVLSRFVDQGPPGPILVPESDTRPARPALADIFDEDEETE